MNPGRRPRIRSSEDFGVPKCRGLTAYLTRRSHVDRPSAAATARDPAVVLLMVTAVSLGIGLSASGGELRMNTHDPNVRRNRMSWSGVALAAFVSLAARERDL